MAATRVKLAGYSTLYRARETTIFFSSSGWRSTSSTLRPNSGQLVEKEDAVVGQRHLRPAGASVRRR